ncbi:pentatricopeptide repeat-containing protein At1g33350-like [Neltuma alba]|uniref:pentatricopeptide repeat-containing protein At1g33350-like n=1 Tax=Neltuma alba TaxID=207710 RepID=UPI0010A3734E|nr:pentatricopeptide repeat-containing protein At1g33350-like [Prosopis alba]XP_028783055.1 pentatricopeptide repeat-containing protein At1g33350-like [Prosopis alba]
MMHDHMNLNEHVLSLLAKSNHLGHLKQLQGYLTVAGHAQTQFYAFKLVRFCTLSLSNLHYARLIFNHLKPPNAYLYTAMITAYASQPDYVSAFTLFRDMVRRRNPKPSQFIYPHVLKSCPEVLGLNGTGLVHAQVLKSGYERYPVVQTSLVDSYSRISGNVGKARKVFDEMCERNVVSWTAMVCGYARMGDIENAMKLFGEMPERDVPSWNAIIAGCTQNGFFSEAIRLFRKMVNLAMEKELQFQHVKPNQVTVVCALSACGHTGMLQLGKWIHGYLYKNGFVLDSFTSNALVDMYGKCGNLEQARKVFEMNPEKGLTSWNSMINSFALHGQSDSAIAIFEQMMECGEGVRPDEVTFIGLLNACTHGGLVEKGYCYFEMMVQKFRIEPQIEHYGCLIDLLGRAGRFDAAMEVVRGMGMEPDEVIWGSLLNGCKIHGRTDLAELAAKKLIEIDPNNGGYGAVLANLYGELGKWDEARNVWRTLKERNSFKIPGCSWIEVDDQVSQFYSLDKSNPKTEEIYSILESLRGFRNEVMVDL